MSTWCLCARMLKFLAAPSENFPRIFNDIKFTKTHFSRARKNSIDNIQIVSMKMGTALLWAILRQNIEFSAKSSPSMKIENTLANLMDF
jgi:hypothetical protein